MASPMEQFEVTRIGPPIHLFGYDISFTNSALWMCIVAGSAAVLLTLGASSRRLVPTRLQSLTEMSYVFVADMIRSASGTDGLKFFPFIFTLFFFVLFANVYGMFPLGLFPLIRPFTVTSHIVVTFALAIFVFVMVIVVGIAQHGHQILRAIRPQRSRLDADFPGPDRESISFCSRPISLSVRLFANMMAGHTMLNVFGGFVIGLAAAGGAVQILVLRAVARHHRASLRSNS